MGEFQCCSILQSAIDFDFSIDAGGMWWTSVVKSKWMMLRQPLSGNLRNKAITVVLAVAKLDDLTLPSDGVDCVGVSGQWAPRPSQETSITGMRRRR